MRGRSLAVRLAVLLAGVVIVVLLAAGWVVNQAASRSLAETIGPRDEQRLELAVAVVEEALERGVSGPPLRFLLDRIAGESGGSVRIVDDSGAVTAEGGRMPPRTTQTESLTRDLSPAAGGGAFELVMPNPQAPFVRTFNAALLLTGIVAVAALLIAAAVVASRLTRPLREVALAAGRLGAGDLTARARGGSDVESTELASAFNGMADQLERSEELRRRAASDLAHDLATPATVLESQLQAMVDGVVPADATQLERARAAAAGLSGFIAQLGELTQAEAAPLQRSPERVAVVKLVREITASLDGLLRTHAVTAVVDAPTEAHARVDRGQLTRALRNLVTNAVQHSPRGGTVRVGVAGGDPVTIRISDEGAGIAAGDLPYVFERFYRADRSRGRTPGSGIGLTVARELIGASGGSVEVESTGPDGTTFRIVLPADA
ncbi:MAG: HAMP domain-containing sensor histidine kinase [Candidatus Limnocylindria bacterium]